jgi:hypothetical protein
MKSYRIILYMAIIISLGILITWRATGGDYYTKFQIVEETMVPVNQDDPLAGTGFYDNDMKTETVSKNEFRLGLLPTPSRLFDKHILSVISIIIPLWTLVIFLAWLQKRRTITSHQSD